MITFFYTYCAIPTAHTAKEPHTGNHVGEAPRRGCETRREKVIKLLCRVLTHEHFGHILMRYDASSVAASKENNWSVRFLTHEACVTSRAALSLLPNRLEFDAAHLERCQIFVL